MNANILLDSDTNYIIEAMCLNTGWEKEKAILVLIEFGMIAMQAAMQPARKLELIDKIIQTVNSDKNLFKTAVVYSAVWTV